MLKMTSSIIFILILSTVMGIASSSWVMVWVCLEANALAMCWLISNSVKKEKSQESNVFLYYIVQVIASALILMMANFQESFTSSMIIMLSILAKMGAWPTHLWYMKLINSMKMSQTSMLIVMTWQKILPITLVLSMVEMEKMKVMLTLIAVATLITPISNLVQSLSMKSIMAVSSFNNNGWLMIAGMSSMLSFLSFLTLYSATLMVTLKSMVKMTTKSSKVILPFWSSTMVVANMGGLPPFTMFWAKVMIIKSSLMSEIPSELVMLMVTVACYFLYHYLWMVLNEISKSPKKQQNQPKNKKEGWTVKTILLTSMMAFMVILTLGLTWKGFILMG